MGELIAALALIVSVISIIFTAYYGRAEQKRQTRTQVTVTLYNDFQGNEMLNSRIKADKFLRANKQAEKPLSLSDLYHTLDVDDWLHISRLAHFFEQLESYRVAGYLEVGLAKALFRPYFSYFYLEYFGQLLEGETEWVALSLPLPQLKQVALWMN